MFVIAGCVVPGNNLAQYHITVCNTHFRDHCASLNHLILVVSQLSFIQNLKNFMFPGSKYHAYMSHTLSLLWVFVLYKYLDTDISVNKNVMNMALN